MTVQAQAGGNLNNVNKKVALKNCAPFADCISEVNNKQIDAKDIDVIMPMYNLMKYTDDYSKTSGSVWQYYREEAALTDAGAMANFSAADNSASLNFKQKITGKIAIGSRKNVETLVPLKYLSNFWRNLEMPLINCEINQMH